MLLFKKVVDLQIYLQKKRAQGDAIGFVPTMGALHKGHLSLIAQSKADNDCTVCSIFVNPTQFNDAADLDKYPRTTAQDIEVLTAAGNDVLFLPDVEEIYPPNIDTNNPYDFGDLANVMEGAFRPGHFDGMAQVVKRLLDIVLPDVLYMGQKDFQQLTIVRNMLVQMKSTIKLVMCPIIREADGLAMSSRNARLKPEHRQAAPIIHQILQAAKAKINKASIASIKETALKALAQPDFKAEYFEIADGISLQAVKSVKESDFLVACVAVWVGEIRLIDNVILKNTL